MAGEHKDALISYSRKDQDFVRRLSKALNARGLDAWVDWEGIPLTSKWLAEIEAAIEAATTFIFVISPDSIASEICHAEIRHAAKHRKKFIPLVYRDIDAKSAPSELSEWQWLFFRSHDDFDAACDSLFAAITTDLDHVRTHTRLLVRAREWEDRGEPWNLVLRGRNLHEALDWLRQCAGKKPEPSELHERFVTASRKAARTLAAVRAVVAVLFVTAVAAGFIYFRAARQQTLVSRHEDYATAINLAEAEHLKQDYAAALDRLRGLAPQDGESDIREFAWRYLWGLYDSHRSAIVVDGPTSIAISPDSRTLSITDASSLATLWDLETGRLTQRLDDPEHLVSRAVFVDGGSRLAVGGSEGTRIWERAGSVAPAPPSLGGSRELVPSPDGRLLFGLPADRSGDVAAKVWNLAAGTGFEWQKIGQRGELTAFAFRPDSREMVLTYAINTVRRFDLTTGRETRLTLAGSPHMSDVCFPNDKMMALAVTEKNRHEVVLWDLDKGTERLRLEGPQADSGELVALRCALDGRRVAMLVGSSIILSPAQTNSLVVWNVDDGRHLYTLDADTTGFITAFAFSPRGDRIASGSRDHGVRLWNAATGDRYAQLGIHHGSRTRGEDEGSGHSGARAAGSRSRPIGAGISQVEYSADGRTVVTASRELGTVRIWTADGPPEQLYVPQRPATTTAIATAPDGALILTGDEDGTIALWDAAKFAKVAEVVVGAPLRALAFSRRGDAFVFATDDGSVRRGRIDHGRVVVESIRFPSSVQRWLRGELTFGDGAVVAVSQPSVFEREPHVRAWDRSGRQQLPAFTARSVSVTRDASHLAMTDGCVVTVWNLERWTPDVVVDKTRCARFDFTAVAVSPDGRYVAAGGPMAGPGSGVDASGILLIGPGTNRETFLPLPNTHSSDAAIQSLEFSPDGRSLVAVSAVVYGRNSASHLPGAIVTVWDVSTGSKRRELSLPDSEVCTGFRGSSCARIGGFASDRGTIAIVRGSKMPQAGRSEVVLWDGNTDEKVPIRSAHRVDHLSFAPDGRTLFTLVESGGGAPAIVWDRQSGRSVATLGDYSAQISSLRQLADRTLVATFESTSAHGTVSRVWDLSSGTQLMSQRQLGDDVTGPIFFAHDGRRLAVGRARGMLFWDLQDRRQVSATKSDQSQDGGLSLTATFSPNDVLAASGAPISDRNVSLWEVGTGRLVDSVEGAPPMAFSPAGDTLATTRNCRSVELRNVSEGRLRFLRSTPDLPACPHGLIFAPDGQTLLTMIKGSGALPGSSPAHAALWNVRSARTIVTLQGYESGDAVAAFSPDGRTIATAGPGATHLWDPVTGRRLATLSGSSDAGLAFSADANTLTAAAGAGVRSWRVPRPSASTR